MVRNGSRTVVIFGVTFRMTITSEGLLGTSLEDMVVASIGL